MSVDKVYVYFDYKKNTVDSFKESEMTEYQSDCLKKGLADSMSKLIKKIIDAPREVQENLIENLKYLT